MSTAALGRARRLAKEGLWIAVGQVASVSASLVLVRVLTGFLQPVEYGELALALTLVGLMNQLVTGGVIAGVGRFYPVAVEKGDVARYLSDSLRLSRYLLGAIVMIAAALVVGCLLFGRAHWVALVIAAAVYSVVAAYNAALSAIQNAARQRLTVALHSALDSWLKIAISIGMLKLFGVASVSVISAYCVSSILVTASQLVFLRKLVDAEPLGANLPSAAPGILWRDQILQYAWPFSTWGAFTWLQMASDRWGLETFGSTADVGAYAVLFQVGYTPVATGAGFLLTLLGPILFQRSGDASDAGRNLSAHKVAWQATWLVLGSAAFAFLFTLLFHRQIWSLLVSGSFASSSNWLPWMVLAGGLFAAGQVLSLKLMSDLRPAAMAPIKIVTAIAGTAMNVVGSAYWGLAGVVCANVAFSFLYLAWVMFISTKRSEYTS